MADDLQSGYMGLLTKPSKVRCTSFSVNNSQDILFYNPVYGIDRGSAAGNKIRRLFRPSVGAITGSFSFPATESAATEYLNYAQSGGFIDEIGFQYFCTGNNFTSFKHCRVNGFEVNAQAGEVVNITVDIGAKDLEFKDSTETYINSQKLITWDKVTVTSPYDPIRAVTLKINNNLAPVYTAGDPGGSCNLLPNDLRLGIQELSGSISVYLRKGQAFIPTTQPQADSLGISFPGFDITAKVFYRTTQSEGMIGPAVCEIPFTGVDSLYS